MRTIHDYQKLEREFFNTRPRISIRELAKRNDIKSFSTLAAYARSHGWYDRRDRIDARTDEKVVERVSDQLAEAETDELMQFRSEALAIARATVYKYADQLKDPMFRVSTAEVTKIVNLGLLILGEPTSRTEERRLELTGTLGELSPEFLRRLVEASRPGPVEPGRTSSALPALPTGTREN